MRFLPSDASERSDAVLFAERLVFGPLLFQAAVVLRRRGVFRALLAQGGAGMTLDELCSQSDLGRYGLTVLLEAGLAAGALQLDSGDRYRLTRVGILLERDPMTIANLDFVADVCYRAASHLDASVMEGRAEGLAELSGEPNVYEGLSTLPEPAQSSWFAFDHFYSDKAFTDLVPRLLRKGPKRVLDVGANTGRFARSLLAADANLTVTLADLPRQLTLAERELGALGLLERARFHPVDLLATSLTLPRDFDTIWMSQLLCCFAEEDVLRILKAAREALGPDSELWIVDTFWDRQEQRAAAVTLMATSLYFTTVANGRGRMYDSETMQRLIREAGLLVRSLEGEIGLGHSLIVCARGERQPPTGASSQRAAT